MMSTFFYVQPTLNRLFKYKIYWYCISSFEIWKEKISKSSTLLGLKYNYKLKANNNINKRPNSLSIFCKKKLIYIESMFPVWISEYIRKV